MAFKMKSGNSPVFKKVGSYAKEEESPNKFLGRLRDKIKDSKFGQSGFGQFALGGGLIGAGVREITGANDDCDCEEVNEDAQAAIEGGSEGEESTMIGQMKKKAQGLFGGEHWKKLKKEKSEENV